MCFWGEGVVDINILKPIEEKLKCSTEAELKSTIINAILVLFIKYTCMHVYNDFKMN